MSVYFRKHEPNCGMPLKMRSRAQGYGRMESPLLRIMRKPFPSRHNLCPPSEE